MTLSALIKSATLTSINAALIPTAPIGPSAARIHHVLMGRVTATVMENVKTRLFVAMTSVEADHQIWTVV